ncbi:F0F1 ATP synthase subunit A, partial [Candidatus Babeliales bacterium]|nr:F0F1 ATP synthase subunit A [Candidatus Babeliales bacterium]
IFYFSITIFIFIGGAGFTGLIPYAGEATQDLNTTFALGISSFCYSQYQGIKAHGLAHFKEYLQPFFLLLPLNIVGECAKAASMSFRLFGNILGGSIMVGLILDALGSCKEFYLSTVAFLICFSILLYSTPLLRYFKLQFLQSTHTFIFYAVILVPTIELFFGVIESLVQAFVLTTLTITYSSMAIGDEEDLAKSEGA